MNTHCFLTRNFFILTFLYLISSFSLRRHSSCTSDIVLHLNLPLCHYLSIFLHLILVFSFFLSLSHSLSVSLSLSLFSYPSLSLSLSLSFSLYFPLFLSENTFNSHLTLHHSSSPSFLNPSFFFNLGESERVRTLYSRLLERTSHVKVWISYALFEASEAKALLDVPTITGN